MCFLVDFIIIIVVLFSLFILILFIWNVLHVKLTTDK